MRRPSTTTLFALIAGAGALAIAYSFGSFKALAAGAMGIALAVGSHWLTLRFVVRKVETDSNLTLPARVQLAGLVKLVLLGFVTFFTISLGAEAVFAFLAAHQLVYWPLVIGLLQSQEPSGRSE